jgi:hypothetical protein
LRGLKMVQVHPKIYLFRTHSLFIHSAAVPAAGALRRWRRSRQARGRLWMQRWLRRRARQRGKTAMGRGCIYHLKGNSQSTSSIFASSYEALHRIHVECAVDDLLRARSDNRDRRHHLTFRGSFCPSQWVLRRS